MGTPVRTFTVDAGFVTVPVVCPRRARGSCDGRLWLERRVGRRMTRLGVAEFFTRAGRRDPVQVGLTRSARRLVNQKKKIKATLRVRARDTAGNNVTARRGVEIRAAVAARRR